MLVGRPIASRLYANLQNGKCDRENMINGMLEKALLPLINKKLTDAGEVKKLTLDRKEQVITLILALEGETSDVAVSLVGARIVKSDGFVLIFDSVESSRPWVSILLSRYASKFEIRIPEKYAVLVKQLL